MGHQLHFGPVSQHVLPVQTVYRQLFHPTDKHVLSFGLQMVNKLLSVDIHSPSFHFAGYNGQADVHRSVDFAAVDVGRSFAVDKNSLIQNKVPLQRRNISTHFARKCVLRITLCQPFKGHLRFLCKKPLKTSGLLSYLCPSFRPSMISHSELRRRCFFLETGAGWACSVALSALRLLVSALASESLATLLPDSFSFVLPGWGLFFLSAFAIMREYALYRFFHRVFNCTLEAKHLVHNRFQKSICVQWNREK